MNMNVGENRASVYNAILEKMKLAITNPQYLEILTGIVIEDLNLLPVPKLEIDDNRVQISASLNGTHIFITWESDKSRLIIETIEQNKKNLSDIIIISKANYEFNDQNLTCTIENNRINTSMGAAIIDSRIDEYKLIDNEWIQRGDIINKYTMVEGEETDILVDEQTLNLVRSQFKRSH